MLDLPTAELLKRVPHSHSEIIDIIVIQCPICNGMHGHTCLKIEEGHLGFKLAGCNDGNIVGGYDIIEKVQEEEPYQPLKYTKGPQW